MDEHKTRPDVPGLGTAEAGVRSIVNMISYIAELREEQVAYWLDAYYQLRVQYERENAPEPDDTILHKADLEPVLRKMWQETIKADAKEKAAQRMDQKKRQEEKIAQELAGEEPGSPPAASHDGEASYKRAVRETLLIYRGLGLSIPDIVTASNGAITDGQILTILEGGKQPVEVYRALDQALKNCKLTKN